MLQIENPAKPPAHGKGPTLPAFGKTETLRYLDERGIAYDLVEHEAVFTMEGMDALELPFAHEVVKNLFLRDKKKRSYFLVVMDGHKTADLKGLRTALGSAPLTFASEEDLHALLGLHKGAVTPLGILNDDARRVEVVLDADLRGFAGVGVHPCDNTASIHLRLDDLLAVFVEHGTPYRFVAM